MNRKVCHQLVLNCWITGFLSIFPPLVLELKLDFYASKVIDQFLCDTSPILQLSYTDTHVPELMAVVLAVVTLVVTLLLVVLSYTYIFKIILKFPSVQQWTKAFSTCFLHMVVVSITYGSCIFTYMKSSARKRWSSAKKRVTLTKVVAVLSTSVGPLLKPFINTLKRQQVKEVLKDVLQRFCYFQNSEAKM